MSQIQGKSRQRGGTLKALFIIDLLLFSTFLGIGLLTVFPSAPARLFGVQTQGVVQNVSACTANDSSGDVTPTIQFTDRQGRSYRVTDNVCGEYAVGETVTVWYEPNNPHVVTLQGDDLTLVVLSLLTALFGLAALVLLGWFLIRRLAGSRVAS